MSDWNLESPETVEFLLRSCEILPQDDFYSVQVHVKGDPLHSSVAKDDLQDFQALSDFVRGMCNASQGKKLVISWRDKDDKEILIENDNDFRESIDAQNVDGSNLLVFHAIVTRKRVLPSLPTACNDNHNRLLELVRYWCRQGKEEHRSPLYSACENGNLEGVKALLECTLDMVPKESNFVKTFMRKSIAERVNEALEDGSTSLHIAAWLGHTEIASFLIAQGADLEVEDKNHRTSLYKAVVNGHKEIVVMLVAAGVIIDRTYPDQESFDAIEDILAEADLGELYSNNCNTLMHIAAQKGHTEIVSFLIAQKADLEAMNSSEWTPLNCAVNNGQTEIARVLIANRANIESTTEFGQTPLHVAVRDRHSEMISLLIDAKANLMAENEFGLIPVECAYDQRIEALLRDAMNTKVVQFHIGDRGRELEPLRIRMEKVHEELFKGFEGGQFFLEALRVEQFPDFE